MCRLSYGVFVHQYIWTNLATFEKLFIVWKINEIIKPENLVYGKPRLMNENPMHYCPGCSHGVIHKLIAEVIAEMGMEDKTIGISPVGCAVFCL